MKIVTFGEVMLAVPIPMIMEDVSYEGTASDYGFLFDYSSFDGGYDKASVSATATTGESAIFL